MSHRALVRLALGALTVAPVVGALPGTAVAGTVPAPPAQQGTQTTSGSAPPPPGTAEANALLVAPLLAVAHTKATASPSGGSATANALEVGGTPLVPGTTGGTQQGAGSKHGALVDTGATPLGQLQVLPWEAAVTQSGAGTSADGDAALLRVFLVDPAVLRAAVLQSHSHAQQDASGSSGSSSSDGAVVVLGNGALDVRVLHAESSSSSGGRSYLVSVNGNQIGTSQQANGGCTVTVPGVASLSCLSTSGGRAATAGQAASSVADATLGAGQVKAVVVGTNAAGQRATLGSGAVQQQAVPTASSPSSGGTSLPFTGASLPPVLGIGTFLLAAGAWVHHAARRLRTAAALT